MNKIKWSLDHIWIIKAQLIEIKSIYLVWFAAYEN